MRSISITCPRCCTINSLVISGSIPESEVVACSRCHYELGPLGDFPATIPTFKANSCARETDGMGAGIPVPRRRWSVSALP